MDIARLRNETPGCHQVLHFNNAGAALPPTPVVDAIKKHLDLEAQLGGYEAHTMALERSEKIYHAAATLINANPNEIAFCENATRAWDMAFYSMRLKKGDRILTAMCEYASNYLAFLHQAKHSGINIQVIRNDAFGQLDLEDLQNQIDDRVKLIAITHVPTQGGLINPAEEIGKISKKHQIPFLLDATQSVGQMAVDVKKIGCDFLCATGRKYLRGPRGTGFLYACKEVIEQCDPPFIDLHSAKWISDNNYLLASDAQRFETWEQNIAGKIGLGVAIDYANQLGVGNIWNRIQLLANQLRYQLAKIPSIELQDLGKNKCGIITFSSKNKSVEEIKKHLANKKINVSISLQEYARLDMAQRNLPALLRASVHYYNTEEEIQIFCEEIEKLFKGTSI